MRFFASGFPRSGHLTPLSLCDQSKNENRLLLPLFDRPQLFNFQVPVPDGLGVSVTSAAGFSSHSVTTYPPSTYLLSLYTNSRSVKSPSYAPPSWFLGQSGPLSTLICQIPQQCRHSFYGRLSWRQSFWRALLR